jgi:hypothetical protein
METVVEKPPGKKLVRELMGTRAQRSLWSILGSSI